MVIYPEWLFLQKIFLFSLKLPYISLLEKWSFAMKTVRKNYHLQYITRQNNDIKP